MKNAKNISHRCRSNTDYDSLAKVHADIWWNHDKRNFNAVKQSAYNLLCLRNFPKNVSQKAANNIMRAYYFYDKAVINRQNDYLRESFFEKMNAEHLSAMDALKLSPKLATYYTLWWKKFYYKDDLGSLFYLFCYHLISFPLLEWPFIFWPFFNLFKSGSRGHNKRNKAVTIYYLKKYWIAIDRLKIRYHIFY